MSSYCIEEPKTESQLALAETPGSKRFPEDLRLWVSNAELFRLAQGVAQEQTPSGLRPVFSFTARRFHHPWRMLALITYALARGLWPPRALAEIAAFNPDLVSLCHGETPSADVIRQFQSKNREPIVYCLDLLLRRIWCQRHDQRITTLSPLLKVEILCDARARMERAQQSEPGGTDDSGQ